VAMDHNMDGMLEELMTWLKAPGQWLRVKQLRMLDFPTKMVVS
jgi:hypothetical protein